MYRWNQYWWWDVRKCWHWHIWREKKPDYVIRYHVKVIIDKFFEDESVTYQGQILRGLLTSKELKDATTLLGILKSTKDKKVKENVIQNINSALKKIGISRKKNVVNACRAIQMTVALSSTKENHLVKYMEKYYVPHKKHCTNIGNFDCK